MAADSKTEAPTPQKRKQAREEGRVAVSRDLTAGLSLLAACLMAKACLSGGLGALATAASWTLSMGATNEFESKVLLDLTRMWAMVVVRVVLPIVSVAAALGLALGLGQTRMLFSFKPLEPKFEKLNPASGVKRIFSVRGIVEGAKSVLKVCLVLGMAAWALWGRREEFVRMTDCSVASSMSIAVDMIFLVSLRCAGLLVAIGVADYAYQWWEMERSLKMTRQEVIDELKRMEGDPHIRARRKALRRNMLQQGISPEATDANVVVVNPTHIAVALLYKPGMIAPKVVAKGRHLIAQRIVKIARKHGKPVIRNIQIARGLYKTTAVGDYVPGPMYQAVAEILAAVYRQAQARRARQDAYRA